MQRRGTQEDVQQAVGGGPNVEQSRSCTVYSPRAAYREIWECVQLCGLPFSTEGSVDRWDQIVVQDGPAVLTLRPLQRSAGGDRLSKILLGTINYFRQAPGPEDRRRRVLEAVSRCQMIVGARAVPDYTDGHLDLIFAVARVVDGLIFNGLEMLNFEGRTVLANDGYFEA